MREIPGKTIEAFARSIYKEASRYGFNLLDVVRLVNALMELCSERNVHSRESDSLSNSKAYSRAILTEVFSLPAHTDRLRIVQFEPKTHVSLLEKWLKDDYGRHFLLSSTTAQKMDLDALIHTDTNHIGLITLPSHEPIGLMAYLDHNPEQKRAELRKLIGEPAQRGHGIAEEATRLWISYGINSLGLEKIYVSTMQTHVRNIKLNEDVGFVVEGLLRNEVLFDGIRHDVLRMGLVIKT